MSRFLQASEKRLQEFGGWVLGQGEDGFYHWEETHWCSVRLSYHSSPNWSLPLFCQIIKGPLLKELAILKMSALHPSCVSSGVWLWPCPSTPIKDNPCPETPDRLQQLSGTHCVPSTVECTDVWQLNLGLSWHSGVCSVMELSSLSRSQGTGGQGRQMGCSLFSRRLCPAPGFCVLPSSWAWAGLGQIN